jgi:hypothetical protein
MKITFFEMRLLNDTSQMHDTSFIQNKKEWGESNIYIQREKEREQAKSERWSVAENGLQRGS